MVRWILNVLAFSAVMFGVTACGGRDASSINGLSADDAAQLNSERSTSWDSEDPPIRAQTHIAAGQLAESQGDYSSAITQYKKAIALDSQSSLAVYRMGIVYSQMRAYPDAINAWTTYSRMTGGAPEASANLGFAYELSGDAGSAANTYQTGIAKSPKHTGLRVNYGLMLARSGKVDEARQQLAAVLSDAQNHYNIGSVYEIQGRKELARQEYIQAIQADPNFLDARSRLATLDHN